MYLTPIQMDSPVLLSGRVYSQILLRHVDAVPVHGQLQLPNLAHLLGRQRYLAQDPLGLLEHLVHLNQGMKILKHR